MARTVWRFVPGAAGAVLVTAGAALIYLPAGLLVAGAFLLALDRRL